MQNKPPCTGRYRFGNGPSQATGGAGDQNGVVRILHNEAPLHGRGLWVASLTRTRRPDLAPFLGQRGDGFVGIETAWIGHDPQCGVRGPTLQLIGGLLSKRGFGVSEGPTKCSNARKGCGPGLEKLHPRNEGVASCTKLLETQLISTRAGAGDNVG